MDGKIVYGSVLVAISCVLLDKSILIRSAAIVSICFKLRDRSVWELQFTLIHYNYDKMAADRIKMLFIEQYGGYGYLCRPG